MPSIIVIAGPNGAGKTTFAKEYLSPLRERFEFVNADEIARWSAHSPGNVHLSEIHAGRIMLTRVEELVKANANFAIETTLASLTYARKIPIWRKRGYVVSLIYLRLSSISESIARVKKRVESGGHNIPEEVIRRRFDKSATYFETIYKQLVDSWYVWESREGIPVQLESSEDQ